ncbi:MAG: protocatechuate 3,4-dioxygenase [Candidatus Thiodiazotropha lotti]|nr:protocatechuate 3,4-dioxygenase [Candidatus Thiodiazotropha weberae]MCG7991691.1 protocatechuate 3,4-dioxygenase [Candidatus Thiodiazotropha lotti]MCG7999715.1 protocatechuate 3,4-dioxygenase [Candidatus Thiodiazotropha lotti]MCW4183346.1 protocatechuate 3,4-dioxygenase [Candidatus Thiodiazotropha weberae]MCW4191483.1 protocatechuate 3,4-dioxygenase [Candidatus Thiodiazotropha weberae]
MSELINNRRRNLILGGSAGLLSLPCYAKQLLTPRQSAGPFYPDLPMLDDDNDLTQISGMKGIAKGSIAEIYGKVIDINGNPLSGVIVEIWQCDFNGRYRHSEDDHSTPMDRNFQGFGRNITDDQGRYRFRTIRPVPYPGRTPHIHAAVFRDGMRPFVTQIYVAGEAQNSEDFLFQRIPSILRPMVLADFRPTDNGIVELMANFDFVLMDGFA